MVAMSRQAPQRPDPAAAEAVPGDLLGSSAAGPAAIRGGVLRAGGYVGGVLLSVGAAAMLFRHLGVVDGGRYVTVISLVAIAGGISDAGLTAIGVREMAVRAGADRDRFARNLLGMRVLLTLAGAAGAVAFAAIAGYDRVMVLGTALAGAGLVFQNTQLTLAAPLMSGLRLGLVTATDLLRQLLTVLGIVVLVVAGASLLPFFAVMIVASLATLVLTAVLVRRDMPLRPAFHPSELRGLMRDVLPFSAASAAHVMYFRVAIVMVSLITTAEQTGYFGASFRIIDVLAVVPSLVVSAAFPIFARAARDDHARLAYGIERVFQACVVGGALVALGLALGAGFAIDVVAGPEFRPAADMLRIQAVAIGATFAGAVWGYAMLSLKMYRQALFVNGGALIGCAILVAVLASTHEGIGAAIATAIAELGLAIAGGIVLIRAHPHLRPSLGVLWRVAIAAAVGATAALATFLPEVARAILGCALFLAVAVALRAVPEELLQALRRRAKAV
jgi:O-antigen/teichoic acid export membrane protein